MQVLCPALGALKVPGKPSSFCATADYGTGVCQGQTAALRQPHLLQLRNMVLILCIGDLHIPHRTPDLPPQFKELLKPGKIHSILCAGNLCSKTVLEYLRNICPDVTLVQGDFDEFTSPEQAILNFGDLKIGLIHGHQVIPYGNPSALSRLHRQMAVDILVTAHTHDHKISRTDDGLMITLGSATGAYSSFTNEVTPSFVLLDVDGAKATVYVYQLKEGKVKVDRSDFTKAVAPIAV